MTNSIRTTLTLSTVYAAATMLLAGSAPVAATTVQTEGPPPIDPVVAWVDRTLPRNKFALDSNQNIELMRFKTPRDVEVCVSPSNQHQVDAAKSVPVTVTWDDQVGEVQPGNCLSFDARTVKIRAASPLAASEELTGTFRVVHH